MAHTEEGGSHDGRSIWKTLGKSFLLQGWPRASLNESLTHSTLTLSPYFKATAGGEGSGSINPLVVDQLVLILTKDISEQDEAIDIIMHQRREQNEQIEGGQDEFPNSNTPSQTIVSPITSLSRLFCFMTLPASFLYFKPLLSDISMAVRKVKVCISESSSPFMASSPGCRSPFKWYLPSYSLHWLPGCPCGSLHQHVSYTPTQKAVRFYSSRQRLNFDVIPQRGERLSWPTMPVEYAVSTSSTKLRS